MKKRLIALLLLLVMLAAAGTSTAVTYYRVNVNWLKAREKPSYSATVIDSYRRDFAATIAQRYSGGWAKVRFRPSGRVAYVQAKYLKACKSYTAYIKTDRTLLRSGPALSFTATGRMNRGTKVTVLTHGAAFDYVSTPKGKGYIRNSYLTTKKPSGRTAFIRNPSNLTVNLRKGPGYGYAVIAEYRPGTKVTVYSYGKAWSRVSVKGRTGYMMSKYLSWD